MTSYETIERAVITEYAKYFDKATTEFVVYFTQKENNGIWYRCETVVAKITPNFNGTQKVLFNHKISDEQVCIDTIHVIPLRKVIDYYGENVIY